MWWLDPGKEVLNLVFNRILAPYLENLDMNLVNYGIGQGQLTLQRLRLKRGALDKFRLPVDVIEGHLGKLTLSLHWRNLGNQPAEILIEDLYLLVVPSPHGDDDPEESEKRAQAAKAERLRNAELLHVQSQADDPDTPQQQGLLASIIAKILNNLQVTIKNIHIRYEDSLSVAGHPFAVGITLASLSAISVDNKWQPAFIESSAGTIHKVRHPHAPNLLLLMPSSSRNWTRWQCTLTRMRNHQFILKPVSGEGRVVMNTNPDNEKPRFDVQALFETIGVILDDNQYRDAISLVDMFHFYARQHQYRKYRPANNDFEENKARALLKFACAAVLDEVHERNRRWTWTYFAERRDDRHTYVDLFKKKQLNLQTPEDAQNLDELEKKLGYEDIRFYRSIARSQLRKDAALRKRLEEEKMQSQASQQSSWTSWLWGSSSSAEETPQDSAFHGPMTEQQKKELYDVLDYDERAAVAGSFEIPRETVKLRVSAHLKRGSFALKSDPHGANNEVISVDFNVFQATVLQRPDNFEVSASLGGFGVFDNTTKETLYRQIVQVKTDSSGAVPSTEAEPFFFVKFEQKPLDERADMTLAFKMRHMEIIYHRGYVEAVYRFFKPPESQLESVEALLNAASETLEGIRKETRAGLEYALQTHKTVDLQVDMNAPIIIVPESITSPQCTHLLVDAGHISIESNLAAKNAVKEIHMKRNQTYTDEDYARLEALMYDKLSVKLHAAQFVIGNDLESCRKALTSADSNDSLHLIERLNIDLLAQNSIVPAVTNLTRFKLSGSLPSLKVNFSDAKYKAILRLIDVTIPHFGDEGGMPVPARPAPNAGFRMTSSFLGLPGREYNVVDDDENEEMVDQSSIEPPQSGALDRLIRQKIFELDFRVETLSASIAKAQGDVERPLGSVAFSQFSLGFGLEKYGMKVDVRLGSLSMNLTEAGAEPLNVLSSADSQSPDGHDLLTVDYTRVQKNSPEFLSIYGGIDQSVEVTLSTVVVRVSPEAILTLYDFVMTTFVPSSGSAASARPAPAEISGVDAQQQVSDQNIRVAIAIFENASTKLATLALSTANASISLVSKAIDVDVKLGTLTLTDDSAQKTSSSDFKLLLSHEGSENLAEVRYRTYDPNDKATNTGVKSAFHLKAASLKFHYLEQPLHDLYVFLMKLAKLKGLYDAATQVAVQRAAEIERMQFDIAVSSPVVIFPVDPVASMDVLTMRLGAISAKNSYAEDIKIEASLSGVQLTSTYMLDKGPSVLKLIEDIQVTAEVLQPLERRDGDPRPDTQVNIIVSDVRLSLTERQYGMIINLLLRSIPRVLAGAPEGQAQADNSVGTPRREPSDPGEHMTVALMPELLGMGSVRTSLDLAVAVGTIKLHLYDSGATAVDNFRQHGIARLALTGSSLKMKMLSDGSMELQVVLKSFTMNDIRPGPSMFHEIIPAAQHQRNQFMVLYTSTGGPSPRSLAVITVDSPQLILVVELVFALLTFVGSAFREADTPVEQARITDDASVQDQAPVQKSGPEFRLDIHDIDVVVLENNQDSDSQAIRLSVGQISLSQQEILALSVYNLGMSLMRMGQRSDVVRLLDDFDLTLSLDSRATVSHQMMSIEINCKPIILRASYRDILLILGITNKVIHEYNRLDQQDAPREGSSALSMTARSQPPQRPGLSMIRNSSQGTRSSSKPLGKAKVLMSKEKCKATIEGLKLVVIGDIQEQPLLHVHFKAFCINAKDWTGQLEASTTIALSINYWNLSNSHWEPLIDPWTLTMSVAKPDPAGALVTSLTSKDRLNMNISTTSIELALDVVKVMSGQEGERVLQTARGTYAPYRIRNRTGTDLFIWSDAEGVSKTEMNALKLDHRQTLDWRFDDWRTMREHVSSRENSIAIQFIGQPWEQLRSVPVDREGEYTFLLRPRAEAIYSRLLCEVKVEGGVKIVTLRSTYKISNLTLYPVEIGLSDDEGHAKQDVVKLAPGQDYSLPIVAIGRCRVRVQPDQGFGYKWSAGVRWSDLITRQSFTFKCPHSDQTEAGFRFHAFVKTDAITQPIKKYPKIELKLRAPIELENLLPCDVQYRVYDKDSNQNWRSFLRKGGVMPVHSVELEHLVLLNVEIQESAFKASDFAIINTDNQSDFEVEKSLTLADNHGRKLDLKLNYIKYPDSGGAFKVQIYSPYLVINKTGLPFGIRAVRRAGAPVDVAGDSRVEVLSGPTPFLLSHVNDDGKEFVFRIGSSSWSRTISLDAPSAETELVMTSETKVQEHHIGLSWTVGLGKYKLTKVITLAPRFLVKNNIGTAIKIREHCEETPSTLGAGQQMPLFAMKASMGKLLTVAWPGIDATWSPPFSIVDIGSVYLRVKEPGQRGSVLLVRVDVKVDGAVIFITFNPAENDWPFTIENDSNHPITFWQAVDVALLDLRSSEAGPNAKPKLYPLYELPDHTLTSYAWDFPAQTDKKLRLRIYDFHRDIDIMEIGPLMPFDFRSREGRRSAVSLDVRADGAKQILRISTYSRETSVYQPRGGGSMTSSRRSDSLASSVEAFEAVYEDVPPTMAFKLDFEGIGVSLINKKLVEVVYLTMLGLKFEYTTSPVAQAVNLSCGTLQIDNQLHDALFPVVLQPTPLTRAAREVAALPTVQGSVIWLTDEEHGVLFVKYCSILLQALTVEADEDFVMSLLELSQIKGISWEQEQEDVLIEHPTDIPEPQPTNTDSVVYFEVLELQPIRLSLSFMRSERSDPDNKSDLRTPLAVIFDAFTMAVGNVQDASLEMNALAIKDVRLSPAELQSRIVYHYRQEVLRQLYRIIGSADFIGNPVGLFTNVSSGVADIFYEPFQGVVMHGNRDLGVSIAKGAASFVKKTVFGFSNSMTKFTGSIGKGLSVATLDSEYQKQRRMNLRRNKPRHALYGVAAGAEALASSVASGVEGVVMKPLEGAESEGALGFFKGVGKGLVGAVTKPVVGVFDLAANVTEGVRNTTTVFDSPARERVRLPRHIAADKVLAPFSAREALGQYWLNDLENGAYRSESYVAHINIPGGDSVVLLTMTRVLAFWTKRLRFEWDLPFTLINGVTMEDRGIRFAHRNGRQLDKFALVPDKASQQWFFQEIASVVRQFNARRRLDSGS
ncbi:hypothetical protein K488DRAFT_78064 [Vararia minispora EC-137]|uniref:Uncharacterized protein n=1 Tax=Vararia minispora EC-137 TaxID=1314806 RepID=A0ACB8QMU9_9AGAM|nr:hypothetical protein K488DRAFT_78064 [Vararia minispora EC-137]